ncbi:hypothetical protein SLS62_001281 [Diatrype stigma]|uniref:Uncharacterized protein n=1 Tax=Diatrype stigma TaxID=117547 RepID=A0AAN9UZM2_9PEZI
MVIETYHDPLSVLNTPRGYSALVRSLELCLDDVEHEPLDDPLYDEYYLRDVNERRCLLLVYKLIHKYGVDRLIEARFIERWLAKLPWTRRKSKSKGKSKSNKSRKGDGSGSSKDREKDKDADKDVLDAGKENNIGNDNGNNDDDYDDDDERRKNFARYLERKRNRISDICQHLTETRAGRRALVRARLLAKSKSKRPPRRRPDRSGEHIKVVLEISMADDGPDGSNENTNTNLNTIENGSGNLENDAPDNNNNNNNNNNHSSIVSRRAAVTDEEGEEDVDEEEDEDWDADGHLVSRVVDRSAAGQRLRRRHREAMVLNDGTHPPGRGDIIEREHDSNS